MKLVIGGRYNFLHQADNVLIFTGKEGNWNQFEKENLHGEIWSELLDSDLHLIEETK